MKANRTKDSHQKNGSIEKKSSMEDKIQVLDLEDPFSSIQGLLDKKSRNLEKKKMKTGQLKSLMDNGRDLNPDQKASALAYKEIDSNLEIVKEISAAVATLRAEYLELKAERDFKQSQKVAQNNLNVNSIKLDVYKYMMEVQNSLKKVVDNAEIIKKLSCSEHVLKPEEVDQLVCFWRFIKPSETADSTARVKRMIQSYIFLSNKDPRNVNEELAVSYAQIFNLMKKINSSLKTVHPVSHQKEENHVSRSDEMKFNKGNKAPLPKRVIEKVVEPKESYEAADDWIEIAPSNNAIRRREAHQAQLERQGNNDYAKKSNNRNSLNQKSVVEVKNSVKPSKPQIVITDLPASNSSKPSYRDREQRNYKDYSNNGRGFRRYRDQQPRVETATANTA